MAVDTTYTHLRENLASILDEVVDQQGVVIVRRKASCDVALISASGLASLLETAHLLRSPRNAHRLMSALRRVEKRATPPSDIKKPRQEIVGHKREAFL